MFFKRIIFFCAFVALVSADESDDTITPREQIKFSIPSIPSDAFYYMFFESPNDLFERLMVSKAMKEGVDDVIAKYDGLWTVEVPYSSALQNDYGLVVKSKARHHAISSKLDRIIDFKHEKLVVQYDVKFQKPMECGGAYIKLLTDTNNMDLLNFNDKTPYTIMFGPDKCGNDYKLHFIFRIKHPITGEIEEKHAKSTKTDMEHNFSDEKSHLYTLVLQSDNSYEIFIDQVSVNSGNLLTDFTPPVNPPKEIDDPDDVKPSDWDERKKIVNPDDRKPDDWDESLPEYIIDEFAVKPDGWLDDEPLTIADPNSMRPSDWDSDSDGEWEAPQIDNPRCKDAPGCGPWTKPEIKNPAYKGKWSPSFIDNPNYQGIWKPRQIANPNYFEDDHPYKNLEPISAVGIELWSMTEDIVFDNFIITHSKEEADKFAAETWYIKKEEERKADPKAQSVVDAIQEATKDKPWIWGFVVVSVISLICLIFYCMRGSGSKKEEPLLRDNDVMDKERSLDYHDGHGDIDEDIPNLQPNVTGGKGDLESDSECSDQEVDPVEKGEENDANYGIEEDIERMVTRRVATKTD